MIGEHLTFSEVTFRVISIGWMLATVIWMLVRIHRPRRNRRIARGPEISCRRNGTQAVP